MLRQHTSAYVSIRHTYHEDSPVVRISGDIYTTADVAHDSSAASLPPSLPPSVPLASDCSSWIAFLRFFTTSLPLRGYAKSATLPLRLRQHTSAYVSIRSIYRESPPPWPGHTSAYVSIRQHTSHAGIRHDEQDVAAAQILVYNRIYCLFKSMCVIRP